MRFTLHGAHLMDATKEIQNGDVTVEGASIQTVAASSDVPGNIIDVPDMIVMPGFIDVHTHGGGGFNLHTTDAREIQAYANWVTRTGVTSFLIGTVGTPGALPFEQLNAAVEAIDSRGSGAEPLGIHLEGPYINAQRRGAHLPSWLRMPEEAEIEQILASTKGYLRLITLAPELPGASAMIRRLVASGVTVSIGHTDATYEQAQESIQLGITHMTHCFNAMRPLHHRSPGPLAAVTAAPQVRGELIADGIHVHPAMMNVLVKMLGPQRIIAITDALAAAGIADATFEFAGQPAQVICGVARLTDGTITGSVLTMDQALRNLLKMTQVTLQEAIGMLTLNPAQSIHIAERKGRLQAGYDADLQLYDTSLTLQATICRGEVVFATELWLERLKAYGLPFA